MCVDALINNKLIKNVQESTEKNTRQHDKKENKR